VVVVYLVNPIGR